MSAVQSNSLISCVALSYYSVRTGFSRWRRWSVAATDPSRLVTLSTMAARWRQKLKSSASLFLPLSFFLFTAFFNSCLLLLFSTLLSSPLSFFCLCSSPPLFVSNENSSHDWGSNLNQTWNTQHKEHTLTNTPQRALAFKNFGPSSYLSNSPRAIITSLLGYELEAADFEHFSEDIFSSPNTSRPTLGPAQLRISDLLHTLRMPHLLYCNSPRTAGGVQITPTLYWYMHATSTRTVLAVHSWPALSYWAEKVVHFFPGLFPSDFLLSDLFSVLLSASFPVILFSALGLVL